MHFAFAMCINDLEESLIVKGIKGIDIGMVKLVLLLYADDIVLLAENKDCMITVYDGNCWLILKRQR